MNDDTKLSAPGGPPGDLSPRNLSPRNQELSSFTLVGRVLGTDGAPRSGVAITVFERRSLTVDALVATTVTDARGGYSLSFSLPGTSIADAFLQAVDPDEESVESPLLSDLRPGRRTVDLILGEGPYVGRSEWQNVSDRLAPILGDTAPQDLPVSRLEWLCIKADVFPLQLAAYIQAHRLAEGRTIKPQTCYAFLRVGLPGNLLALLGAGEIAWASALRSAWSEQRLPLPGDGTTEAIDQEIESELTAMRELLIDLAVTTPQSGVNQRLILDTAGLSEAQQRVFAELWASRSGTIEDFWTEVSGSSLSAELPLLKFTVHAALVAGNHLETVAALQAERAASNIATLADTTRWSVADWNDVLVARSVTPPDDVDGADLSEKRETYARALFNIIEDGHPSLSLRHSITRETTPPPNTAFLTTFLANNPDFDIVKDALGVYLDSVGSPWLGIAPEDQQQARKNLALVQRVYRLTPRIGRYATTKVLLEQGIASASQVVNQTEEEFVAQFGRVFSDADHHATGLAEAIWNRATEIHTAALSMVSTFVLAKRPGDSLPLADLGGRPIIGRGLADLATILGSLDHCACEHCRSVFSPAAYLADLLEFLDDRNALGQLVERRPDIVHILLNCKNTNTVLPYIDLVNELLESYVLTNGNLPSSSHQTTWYQKELRLHPEHLNAAAYDDSPLTKLVHPWSLPFSLPTVESQIYLRHLGIPRHELLRRFLPQDEGQTAIAAELLGLSAKEFLIVRGTDAGSTPEAFWGFSPETNNWTGILNGTDATDGNVGELLLRGGYTIDGLQELLGLDYINPAGNIVLHYGESCDLADLMIPLLDAPALDRMHRFTRLQRACKIPARMLNVLIMDALGGTIGLSSLRALADVIRLKERLRLDWDVVATFWADVIDARPYASGARSLYERRFLAKDFGDDDDFVVVGDELAGGGPGVAISSDHLPRILAGLGIKASDYEILVQSKLVAYTPELGPPEPAPRFSFANITAMFAMVNLARALELSIRDFVTLAGAEGLTEHDPFTEAAETLRFADFTDSIRKSGLSTQELAWLLRHEFESDPLDAEEAGRILANLAAGLNKIEADAASLADPDGLGLATNLPELLAEQDIATTIKLVERAAELDMDEAQREAFIEATFAGIVDPLDANAVLADYTSEEWAELTDRRAWLFARIVSHLRRRALLHETIATKLGVPATVAVTLVTKVLTDPATTELDRKPLAEVYRLPFAEDGDIVAGLTAGGYANEFAAWLRVAKAARVCRAFDLRVDEVEWYSGQFKGETVPYLDLNALPLHANDPHAPFAEWESLQQALSLRDLSRPGEIACAQIAAAADFEEALDILADHSGWDRAALGLTATAFSYSQQHLANGTGVLRIRAVFETAERLGVSVATAYSWIGTPTTAVAEAIKLAARAKYGEDRWPDVATPLRDLLRERQRDALLDATLAISPARSSNDVFDHLLIDVEMSHCMMTSRILQAITSVQIFIHRVFLRLEPVTFGSQAAQRWEWMKNYRVWEANRKVFLYPENWIEPELRANKTPEYVALEATLMQGNLEPQRVTTALSEYIERLDRVSNLEIIGVYEADLAVWVLARTHHSPHEWFLRQKTSRGAWLPWEAVPVEFAGDAVALFVASGRVHIFWVIAQDRRHSLRPVAEFVKPKAPDHGDGPDPGGPTGAGTLTVVEGDPIDGVVYQIAHTERSPVGEWAKPEISPATEVLVKLGERIHIHLHDVLPSEVRLTVMGMLNFGSSAFVAVAPDDFTEVAAEVVVVQASFSFSPAEKEIAYLGSTFSGSPNVDILEVFLSSTDKQLWQLGQEYQVKTLSLATIAASAIGLDPGLFARGQRYEHRKYREQLGRAHPDDHPIGVWLGQALGGNGLSQTPTPIFDRASKKGVPAFVRQATFWVPGDKYPNQPLVYDDRKRKYLLQFDEVWTAHSKGQTPTPWDGFTASSYYLCPSRDLPEPLRLNSGRETTGRVRDRVSPIRQFGSSIPGQIVVHQGAKLMTEAVGTEGLIAGIEAGAETVLGAEALYHPHSRAMLDLLASRGVDGLYPTSAGGVLFRQALEPAVSPQVALGAHIDIPSDAFDFDYDSAYGIYNWELFYHVPMLIAGKLAAEQRWDEAQKWYHRIFNPIDLVNESGPSKYWRLKPFVAEAQWLAEDQLEVMLGIGVTHGEQAAAVTKFVNQVKEWRSNPFDPHAIARIRPGVYQRALLRKYYDNLIAWADNLFRQDTMESIAEATVLYVLFAHLLGPRPQQLPAPKLDAKSFDDMQDGFDAFSNAIVELEGWITLPGGSVEKKGCTVSANEDWVRVKVVSHFWYFCYPPNPEILKYWDILEDRLFKIRHCQNIEGVKRQLALFQPPIDPALLVAATAAGIDIRSVLAELDSGLPPYRFRSVQARATSFAASVKALGSALLAALERRDGEEIALLRSQHERHMLSEVREVRLAQLSEADSAVTSLEQARALAKDREGHYAALLQAGLLEQEERHFELSAKAAKMRRAAATHQVIAGLVGLIPQWTVGSEMSSTFGGLQAGGAMGAVASGFSLVAAEHDYHANKASIQAGNLRRAADWELQLSQAKQEMVRIDKDIIAARIRVQIAERELDNHDRQAQQAREVDMWMRSKFTNAQLYNWMVGQLSTLYFQSYQLAFDLAKRAERAYRHELAIDNGAPIIKYGYWDSLRSGLLAGEKLGLDLERLDLAYMDRDVREYELRKNVSLARLDPAALHQLQEVGWCEFTIPELLFDLDHPGQVLRRTRSVSLTIPAVTDAHTTLGARLTLLEHWTRRQANADLLLGHGGNDRIATSTATSDAGLFNLDFRDERYLPFEYAGAVSRWKLELPDKVPQFDYRTITDVVVSIAYTAREGGDAFRDDVQAQLEAQFNKAFSGGAAQVFAVHRAFPGEWARFFDTGESDIEQVLTLPVESNHFPYFVRRKGFDITSVEFILWLDESIESLDDEIDLVFSVGDTQVALIKSTAEPFAYGSTGTLNPPAGPETWTLKRAQGASPSEIVTDGWLDPETIQGLLMVVRYELNEPTP